MGVNRDDSLEHTPENQQIIDAIIEGESTVRLEHTPWASDWDMVLQRGRQLGITDRFIKECRLSGTRPAVRRCVKCDVGFLSSGIHNRVCQRCRSR